MTAPGGPSNILVIKHGALGDCVLALGPMAAIRRHHPHARLTLLTTPPFVEFFRATRLFDEIWTDPRQGYWAMARRLRAGRFQRVYDLQTSRRSGWYFHLMRGAPTPEWSGIARGASHRDRNPKRTQSHTLDRQREQLRAAGIADVPAPDLSWAQADLSALGLPARYAMIVPGGSAHRLDKRWTAQGFGAIAARLLARGITPVWVGGRDEAELLDDLHRGLPGSIHAGGRTHLIALASLARGAACALGNDTGPMHMAAVAGAPTLTLFSQASDPALCAPRGPRAQWLRHEALADLSVDDVWARLEPMLPAP